MYSIGLIGLPNSGKSSLFNSLTGSRQKVANFPGITIEKKFGKRYIKDKAVTIVDLPGLYTMDATSMDERVTRDYLLKNADKTSGYVLVIDSTNLRKSLFLALQLKELKIPFVVSMNMIDLSEKRGQKIDLEKLSNALGSVSVTKTVAVKGEGNEELDASISSFLEGDTIHQKIHQKIEPQYIQNIKKPEYIKEKLVLVDKIMKEVILKKISADSLTNKIDGLVLHPILGPFVLIATLILLFQLLFVWADPFMGWIEMGFEFIGDLVNSGLNDGYLKSLIIDGILAGVGGVVVFVPHILFLFILINALEDFGYLGRAAFLLDYIMRKLGLPGKAVIPLLSSHACAIPGIMGARIIENPFQRLVTIMISPLMACSARLPVYTLLIAAIVPEEKVLGVIGLPGLVMFALYAFGIVTALIISLITKKWAINPSTNSLMMELPAYRTPKLKNILRSSWQKAFLFLKKAGTVIFALSIILWGLVTFPEAPSDATEPAINYSAAAKIGKTFQPLFAPLGFDWKMTTALIPSFAAREVLVSAMGTVMSVDEEDEDALIAGLSKKMSDEYSLATLMALLIWFVFSPQCIATVGVIKKEAGGYKMAVVFLVYTLVLAYFFAFISFKAFS
jgi:ferrous iron transport protein B